MVDQGKDGCPQITSRKSTSTHVWSWQYSEHACKDYSNRCFYFVNKANLVPSPKQAARSNVTKKLNKASSKMSLHDEDLETLH